MKLALTGNEWAQVVLSLANVAANRSYNTLRAVLQTFGDAALSDEALDCIRRTQSMSVNLEVQGNTSWQVIVDALSELPIKQAGSLYAKIVQTMSGAKEAT